jgi:hypothetical protein
MSVLGNIVSTIFRHGATATASAPHAGGSAPASGTSSSSAGSDHSSASPPPRADVEAILTKLATQNKEKLDWRRSIVDLMKLLTLIAASLRAKSWHMSCTTPVTQRILLQ